MSKSYSTVTILSTSTRPLKPLIETAIQHEIERLRAGIRRTEQRIRDFEHQHGMASTEFVRRQQNDEVTETLDTIDWIGELQMLERLREKETLLQELRVAD